MFNRWSQYSYRTQKKNRYKVLKFFIGFLILFIIYNCLTAFFFSVWVVDNNTMQPGLAEGDRIIFNSFNPPWGGNNDNLFPFIRGSIVLVDMRHENSQNLFFRVLDGIVRFFTAQRISIFSNSGQHYIKRVIALPGDEISMQNYVFMVKPAGSSYALTEYELSNEPYYPLVPHVSSLWDESLPFSGSMDTIILGPDECFIISDDRSNTNDSRTWGPVKPSLIKARAVLRFWPLNKIGLL